MGRRAGWSGPGIFGGASRSGGWGDWRECAGMPMGVGGCEEYGMVCTGWERDGHAIDGLPGHAVLRSQRARSFAPARQGGDSAGHPRLQSVLPTPLQEPPRARTLAPHRSPTHPYTIQTPPLHPHASPSTARHPSPPWTSLHAPPTPSIPRLTSCPFPYLRKRPCTGVPSLRAAKPQRRGCRRGQAGMWGRLYPPGSPKPPSPSASDCGGAFSKAPGATFCLALEV